jgi:hypothetical protein
MARPNTTAVKVNTVITNAVGFMPIETSRPGSKVSTRR